MLLSLLRPNVLCIKVINSTFSNFLWCGKPKCKNDIQEGEIHHGGLKLHDLSLLDKTLKLSWLKIFVKSKSKSTVFPNDFELSDAFIYRSDYLERIIEATSNRF